MSRRFGEYVKGDEEALRTLDTVRGAMNPDGSIAPLGQAPPAFASTSRRKTAADLADKDNSSDDSRNSSEPEFSETFQSCCKWFVPCISLTVTFVMLLVIFLTSGAGAAHGYPKVALVVFEGLKGTVLHKAMHDLNRAPHLRLLCRHGVCAQCSSVDDPSCARTQSGRALGAQYTYQAGPGIASILTGVNAQRHGVYNDSQTAFKAFTTSSAMYPSIAATLTGAGMRVRTIGTSSMLTALSPADTCTDYGVLDFECGGDMSQHCLRPQGCNTQRVLTPRSRELGQEESSLADEVAASFEQGSPDLLIVHTNKLARNAKDPSMPNFTYSEDSLEYLAEIYELDAVVGVLRSILHQRTMRFRENWLVIVTSAHGGEGKDASGTTPAEDEVIPLVISPVTSAPIVLQPQNTPASQMDVVPTILKWLDVTPTKEVMYDGVVQSICSTGKLLRNCSLNGEQE